jgi:hypothetical protein
MRFASVVSACLVLAAAAAVAESPPEFQLRSGKYAFRISDAEFDGKFSYPARVTIQGMHITVVVTACDGPLPCNEVLVEGTIFWHERTGQWIIAASKEDFNAEQVGGCSDGPMTIDPKQRIIWYC